MTAPTDMTLQEELRDNRGISGNDAMRNDAADRLDLLEALLREAVYAFDYAADMTKPADMHGCDCPICAVGRKIDEVLK
jgi:hypothetical protein